MEITLLLLHSSVARTLVVPMPKLKNGKPGNLCRSMRYVNAQDCHFSDKVAVNETVDAIVTMKRERDSCAGIPKNVVSSWRARLEAMAQAGDTEAGQRLIRSISIEFPTQFEIDANPDEYAQRMALAEEYLLDQVASGDCSQATLTSLATMGFDPGLSYASYRVYAERTLASMPRPNLTLDENVKMISGIKNRLAEFQAQVPSDAMDDANQTVAYWQQTSCRL